MPFPKVVQSEQFFKFIFIFEWFVVVILYVCMLEEGFWWPFDAGRLEEESAFPFALVNNRAEGRAPPVKKTLGFDSACTGIHEGI